MLKKIIYQNQKNVKEDVSILLVEAFPENERPPVEVFFKNLELRRDYSSLLAFYDDEKFIGFSSLIFYEDVCYIFFLAVSPTYRHQGYGGQMLEIIKKDYASYILLLAFEEVNPQYDNYIERKNRQAFYSHHGFKDNELITDEWGVRFQTAYIGRRQVSYQEYQEIFKIGFGEWTIKHLKKAN